MKNYFKIAGDLDKDLNRIEETNNMHNYFRPATDLDVPNNSDINNALKEDIENYLLTIVSGKHMNDECELGYIKGAGSLIVTFAELQRMVNDGSYNIIKAEYFNPEMVAIEYQEYSKEKNMRF